MLRVAIIHFQPLEQYPPVQNFIRFLEKDSSDSEIYVYTTYTSVNGIPNFKIGNNKIKILRIGKTGQKMAVLKRYWNYSKFYAGCLFHLIKKKPGRILYYETLSSLPALLYKKIFHHQTELLIHYHEYISPAEYRQGMKLNNFFHTLEKKEYAPACWVSHTNPFRMEQFRQDILPVKIAHPFILPNYPPLSWKTNVVPAREDGNIKIVYAGAVSIDTMYTREFANWVIAQQGKVTWHIYSLNITDEAKHFFNSLQTSLILLRPVVSYDELPAVLCNYDAGVVLYKGHIANYVYNAPNKIFEYLAVGLDVWLPHVMIGSMEYVTGQTYPKVIALDFLQLDKFNLDGALNKKGLALYQHAFFCEYVLGPLKNKLLSTIDLHKSNIVINNLYR